MTVFRKPWIAFVVCCLTETYIKSESISEELILSLLTENTSYLNLCNLKTEKTKTNKQPKTTTTKICEFYPFLKTISCQTTLMKYNSFRKIN